jgi:hypothetical protein
MGDASSSPVLRVLNALLDASLCEDCLAQMTGLLVGDVAAALHRLVWLLTVAEINRTCDVCTKVTVVYELQHDPRR